MKIAEKDINILALGIVSFILGALLRWNAKEIVWPRDYCYSGPRESTSWAIKELALSEISTAIYVFGLVIILILIAKYVFQVEEKSSEE